MDNTRIEWCNSTWNPVTGCLHKCEYCYARSMARRFCTNEHGKEGLCSPCDGNCVGCSGMDGLEFANGEMRVAYKTQGPYPYGFTPTFHPDRLGEYENKKRGRNIFVCSMADLFGDWVSLEIQRKVFKACRRGPQHNYLFLTKNPGMYAVLDKQGELPTDSNMWFGTSVTKPDDSFPYNGKNKHNLFLSIEPLLADFGAGSDAALRDIGWVIIGAETGHRKGKVVPEKSWVDNIVEQCKALNIPVFMKESLRAIYGDDLLMEFPQGLLRG